MTLNEKVINYKILDIVILYNFDIKFDLSKIPFVGAGHAITAPKNVFL